jgi:hypothetical protein
VTTAAPERSLLADALGVDAPVPAEPILDADGDPVPQFYAEELALDSQGRCQRCGSVSIRREFSRIVCLSCSRQVEIPPATRADRKRQARLDVALRPGSLEARDLDLMKPGKAGRVTTKQPREATE